MRHSPDFHRQIRLNERSAHRPRRRAIGFGAALAATIVAGAAIGAIWGSLPSRALSAPPGPLFKTVDRWAESRKSAKLLEGQDGAPAAIRPLGFVAPISEAPSVGRGPSEGFGFCHSGGGTNCVVDGDTFWIAGEKVRVADIDAPETHPSRCAEEAQLGNAATARLQALLNQGAVTLESADRDTDRYGRKLRIVTRGGRSLGDQLVAEGLARPWTGRRMPWC
jgi:endonuclease YncB( thermonuclease family)